jgi:hypothetical protein
MEWFKKHTDTVIILAGILSSVLWMNGKFNEVDRRFTDIEKDIIMIKTVLIMKNIMPTELAIANKEDSI